MRASLFTLFTCLLLVAPAWGKETFSWPDGARAAVSLSYDDALNSQLDNVVPALKQRGLHASFYLMLSSPVVAARLDEWRETAKQGNELGNHTIVHSCSKSQPGTDWVLPHNDIDTRTVEEIATEIRVSNGYLHAIDGRTRRTLTPPCGHTETANGSYLPAVRDQFVAIKSDERGYPDGFIAYALPSGATGDELIDFVKQNAKHGGVVNIIFHGIGGDHLAVSTEAHNKLLDFLAANQDTYWTDSYINIMTYLKRHYPSDG